MMDKKNLGKEREGERKEENVDERRTVRRGKIREEGRGTNGAKDEEGEGK